MKDKFEGFLKRPSLIATIFATVWLLLYFALGAVIFKNMWNTSPAIPIVGGVVAIVPVALEIANVLFLKNSKLEIALICICPLLCLAYFLFFAFVVSKLVYFFVAGLPYFITAALLALVAFFIFYYPRLSRLWKRICAISLSVIFLLICLICLFNLTPFYIDGGATVFMVDGEYQIAFSTSHQSVGKVEVNGVVYYDSTNGENRVSKLHKICVPREELDLSRSYSICTQSVAINTAYLPSKGRTISKNYTFRPVDDSDGINIYNLSDTHECISGPANAAAYFGDNLDLLILNGDIINDVSTEYQISLIYKLAHRITGGEIPVIFTRGNHECNGKLASRLGEYVGCADRGFYFNLSFGRILSLIVLDTANDIADGSILISPVANFDSVRKEESEWLKGIEKSDCTYNLIISHMAYPLSGYQANTCKWHEWAQELVSLTYGKADIAICGHSHKTILTLPNTPDNAVADFPVLRGSLRSNKYADREGVSPFEFTGTAITLNDGKITVKFTNAKGKVLDEMILEV